MRQEKKNERPKLKSETIVAHCFGCGFANVLDPEKHKISFESYCRTGVVACQRCNLKFSVPKDEG